MPRFTFALEPLLTARRNAERERMLALAALQRQRAGLEDRLRRAQAMIGDGKRRLAGRLTGTLDADALRGEASAARSAMRHAQDVVIELAGVLKRIEAARADLAEAARARRAVERLRERRYEAFRRRLDRAEAAALDELAARPAIDKEW